MRDPLEHADIGSGMMNPQVYRAIFAPKTLAKDGATPTEVAQAQNDALNAEDNGVVVSPLGVGVQQVSDTGRIGIYAEEGEVSFQATYNSNTSVGNDDYTFTRSAELNLSTNPDNNYVQATGGVSYENPNYTEGDWGLKSWQVDAGVNAYGSDATLSAAVRGEVTWSNGTTDIFGRATALTTGTESNQLEAKFGIRRDLQDLPEITINGVAVIPETTLQVESGVRMTNNDPDPKLYIGAAFKFD